MRVLPLLVLLGLVAPSSAQTVDPLKEAGADPLELGRAARSLGDDAVLERVAEGSPALRLAGIRATPWLREPLRAIAPLAEVAGGDDPRLAPAACLASWRIATGLDGRVLSDDEVESETLQAAVTAAEAVAADETLRADLRILMQHAEAHLRAVAAMLSSEAPE